MKLPLSLPFLLPGLLLTASLMAAPMPVILDTDMDTDVGDVAALCELNAMADNGEVEILGVMVSGKNSWSAPCVDIVNTFYGRPDIPIGVIARTDRTDPQDSHYTEKMANSFPQDYQKNRDINFADVLYRQLLAKAADGSVTIIGIGDLTNLASLLDTKGDAASPLTGPALVKQKVAQYVCMGVHIPADTKPDTGKWGNFRTDPESAKEVLDGWPTMITFTAGGKFAESMSFGKKITVLEPEKWPVSLAYRTFFGDAWEGRTAHAADSLAVLIAVRGFEPYFKVVDKGNLEVDEIGRDSWHEESNVDNRRYVNELKNPADAKAVTALMEDLAMQAPKASE